MSIEKNSKNYKMLSALLILKMAIIFSSFSLIENTLLNKISSNNKIYINKSPIVNFLEAIASNASQSFCIKRIVGKPEKYKSFSCPNNMKLIEETNNMVKCINECPENMILGSRDCQSPCKDGFKKVYNTCVNEKNKSENYKIKTYPINKKDPICINGYFLKNYCYSCMGHTDFSGDKCLSPCNKGAILESFCAYEDTSNFRLSQINPFWSGFIRDIYSDLFSIFKDGHLKRPLYDKANNLKEISDIILKNIGNDIIKTDSGKVMIYIRDKFGINLKDPKTYLRNIFQKMFQRYMKKGTDTSKDVLAVVDDLINFNGDYKSDYLDKKTYGNSFLELTVINFLDHICD
jgi:hypothetical protein